MAKKRKASGPTLNSEGMITISFVFDGKRRVKSHQLSEFEVKYLKEQLAAAGEATCNSAISKAAIQNTGILAENVLAESFLAYIKENHHVVERDENSNHTAVELAEASDSRSLRTVETSTESPSS